MSFDSNSLLPFSGFAVGARFAARVPERTLRGLPASVLLLVSRKPIFA